MITTIRVLSKQGKEKFINYIQAVKNGSSESPPISQMAYTPWSFEFTPEIKVEDKKFSTRTEMGQYLVELFEAANIDRKNIVNNLGLWSWLALFWFDILCPPASDGLRKVRENARYIYSLDWRDYYRHLVASSWMICDLHREYSRLFLECPVYIHNDFVEQVASRQDIISNKPLVEVIDRLYWNKKTNSPKKNSSNRHVPGNVRRLIAVVYQFELTYDLRRMTSSEILNLLDKEFNIWKKT